MIAARLLLAAGLLAAAAAPVHARVTGAQQTGAEQLLASGRPADALRILRPAITPGDSAQAWFLYGKALEQTGDRAGAASAYRQVLGKDPNAQRVKLDLARVLQSMGDNATAERLLLDVRSQNPPAQVAANIDRFLSLMQNRDEKGHAWRARATIGAGYDSNVNQATNARTVTLFGLPFALNRDARRRGDGFGFFRGEIDHLYRFDRHFAWMTNLSFGARKNFGVNEFDSFTFNAATGPVLQPGDRTTILLPVFATITRIENSKLAANHRFYSNEFGIAPQVRYALNEMISLNLASVISHKHYFEQANRNANQVRLVPGIDIKTQGAGTFSAGLIGAREVSRSSIFSNRTLGATIGWQYAFAQNFVVSLSATHEQISYDAQEAMNDRIRRDNKTVFGLDAIYQSSILAGDILFSYAHTWNNSNIPLYRFERDVVSVAYRKTF